jgi:hypothetical protein
MTNGTPPTRKNSDHPAGWETGFFRVSGQQTVGQWFRNWRTGEFKELPYNLEDPDWEPIYVYRGKRGKDRWSSRSS